MAGRLINWKAFDIGIRSFLKISDKYPDSRQLHPPRTKIASDPPEAVHPHQFCPAVSDIRHSSTGAWCRADDGQGSCDRCGIVPVQFLYSDA